jgi:MFS family permease
MTVPSPNSVAQDLRSWKVLARFVLLCCGVWLYSADTLVTATIAPAIVLDLNGVERINWTISLYEVGAIIAGAATAMLSQRMGVKRLLICAALIYGGGCAVDALAGGMAQLLCGRLIQGVGGGMLVSLCYVAIHAWYAEHLWTRLFGIIAFIWGVGSLMGPLIGGLFATHAAWREAFWLFAGQAGVLWVIASAWLPKEIPLPSAAQDWPVLPLLALTAATLVIAQAGTAGNAMLAIAGCIIGTLLLYLCARLDRCARVRLLPAQLLDFQHPVGAGLLLVLALSMSTTGFWAYGPLILKILFGTKPLIAGFILAVEAIAWSLATLLVTRAPIASEKFLIRLGALLVAVGAAGFAAVVPLGSLAGMLACAALQGAGFGLCWPSIVLRLVRSSPSADQAVASASPATVQRIGYAVGTALVGVSANLSGLQAGISIPAVKSASVWVFAGFIPILLLALLCAWRFTREPSPIRQSAIQPSAD